MSGYQSGFQYLAHVVHDELPRFAEKTSRIPQPEVLDGRSERLAELCRERVLRFPAGERKPSSPAAAGPPLPRGGAGATAGEGCGAAHRALQTDEAGEEGRGAGASTARNVSRERVRLLAIHAAGRGGVCEGVQRRVRRHRLQVSRYLVVHSVSLPVKIEPGRYHNFFDALRYQNCVGYSILDTCVASLYKLKVPIILGKKN